MKCVKCGRPGHFNRTNCMYCGGSYAAAVFEDTNINCPGCQHPMTKLTTAGVTIDVCERCAGVWFDKGEMEELLRKDRTSIPNREFKEEGDTDAGGAANVLYRSCPRCSKLMLTKNYKRYSGVIIDICGEHGFYLDAGEFEKIVHFIDHGGLEKLHKKEQEERAFQERRRLRREEESQQRREELHSARSQGLLSVFSNIFPIL